MNAKIDDWESYTDDTGRRHWRWPATAPQRSAGTARFDAAPRHSVGMPPLQPAQASPVRFKGK